jgi:hypothetical protein
VPATGEFNGRISATYQKAVLRLNWNCCETIGEYVMKIFIPVTLGVLLGVICQGAAFAQTVSSPSETPGAKTRAEVIAEITLWRANGYNPVVDLTHYPDSALRAASLLAAQQGQPGAQKK